MTDTTPETQQPGERRWVHQQVCSTRRYPTAACSCGGRLPLMTPQEGIGDLLDVYSILVHHLPVPLGDEVMCMCCLRFDGPAFHRLHVAALLVAGQVCVDRECGHPAHSDRGTDG